MEMVLALWRSKRNFQTPSSQKKCFGTSVRLKPVVETTTAQSKKSGECHAGHDLKRNSGRFF